MAIKKNVIETPVEETKFEIIYPIKSFIDETKDKEVWEFQKIIEEIEVIEWVITTTKKIVDKSDNEIIDKKIQQLKLKVAKGEISESEKEDLKLLIS